MNPIPRKRGLNFSSSLIKAEIIVISECCEERAPCVVSHCIVLCCDVLPYHF